MGLRSGESDIVPGSVRTEGRIPVFPYGLVPEPLDQLTDLLWRAVVGDVELAGRATVGSGICPLAGAQFDDPSTLGMVQFFFASAGVAARLGMAAGAHQGDPEWDQSVAQQSRFSS